MLFARFIPFHNYYVHKKPKNQGFLRKNVCKKLENGEQKGVPFSRNAFVLTRNSIHVFQNLSNTFFNFVWILFSVLMQTTFIFYSLYIQNSFTLYSFQIHF